MRRLAMLLSFILLAIPAVGQGVSPAVQQQAIIQQQQMQLQQQQQQLLYQQSQLQRQQQVTDHALSQQETSDAAARNRADLAREGSRLQPVDPSVAARTKALVDQSAQTGNAALPQPLQLVPQSGGQ